MRTHLGHHLGEAANDGLVTLAGSRPFAWADDELTGTDRDWASQHHPKALLHKVNPRHGLTDADYLTLDAWLRAH